MRVLLFALLSLTMVANGQAVRDINYKYLYSSSEPFTFSIQPVRSETSWNILYKLSVADTSYQLGNFSIEWDIRNSLGEKEGRRIPADSIRQSPLDRATLAGSVSQPYSKEIKLIVARVVESSSKRAWIHFALLEPNYPINGFAAKNDAPILEKYLIQNTTVRLENGKTGIVSYYNDVFPTATPAFAESAGRVSKGMKVDSTFAYSPDEAITLTKPGLYLFQNDTTTAYGFAFRVEEDYPRLRKVESLAEPLIYVCTRQEFERIRQAKGDKRAFDRVILTITGDAERAKRFMRSYFRRVEFANQYFTSYKEGWKTDRGMIYIIFGPPSQVFRFADREVWNYKNEMFKTEFEFAKSPTLFDPDNFVLIRNKKYTDTWYEVIDLWRNARF
jgi:GWxTD domain-containing protein